MEMLVIFGAKYLYLLSGIIVLYFFYKSSREVRREMLIFACFSLPLTYLLGLLARELHFNPRPFMVSGVEPLILHARDNGFPSDHVLITGAIASLMLYFNRRVALYLGIVALSVGLSRVYAGVHHSIDVLGSILIALISSFIVYVIIRSWNQIKHKPTPS